MCAISFERANLQKKIHFWGSLQSLLEFIKFIKWLFYNVYGVIKRDFAYSKIKSLYELYKLNKLITTKLFLYPYLIFNEHFLWKITLQKLLLQLFSIKNFKSQVLNSNKF